LCALTGAEAALVANNTAAAALLTLAALAQGREGDRLEGRARRNRAAAFACPKCSRSRAPMLREVGTTNRTRTADYAAAIGARTALILRVHPSNFRMTGFTERPELSALRRRCPGSSTCPWSKTWVVDGSASDMAGARAG
jgi:L-seryl-tRNA(Ser) seleniumtransferase